MRTSWLDGWPAPSPTDASLTSLRTPTHGSGPMRIATPSSSRTFTDYSLPVSRRTSNPTCLGEWIRNFEMPQPDRPVRGSQCAYLLPPLSSGGALVADGGASALGCAVINDLFGPPLRRGP